MQIHTALYHGGISHSRCQQTMPMKDICMYCIYTLVVIMFYMENEGSKYIE